MWKNKSAERPLLPSSSALSLDSPPWPPHPDIRRPFAPTDCGEGRHPANPDSGLDKPPAVLRFSATELERERTFWSLRVWRTPALPLITHTQASRGGHGVSERCHPADGERAPSAGTRMDARESGPQERSPLVRRAQRLFFVCRGSEWISFYSFNVSDFVVALEAAKVDDVGEWWLFS